MTPDLVIAVAAKGECDPVPFLRTLTAQIEASDSLRVEVRVAHDRPGSATHQFPAVDFVACDVGTPLQHLWGAALTGVAATYIAILDIACPPARGWLPAVAVSIRSGLPFAWGPVMPSPSLGKLGLLAYLAEYCQFHRPISRRLNEIPGNNVVFERTLLRGRVDLECNGFEKTFFVWRLADDGVPMTCNEQMLIQFNKEIEWWSYVRRRALHGRCFAARRMSMHGQPSRWVCLLGSPLIPALRLVRIYRWARLVRSLRRAFWALLPRLVVAETAWGFGECQGYSVGAGGACENLD